MKRIILLSVLFSFALFSCKEDNEIGGGENPRLNIEKYVFSREGETIDVYSTINNGIIYTYDPEDKSIHTMVAAPGEPKITGIDGGWFRVYYPLPSLEPEKLPYKKGAGLRIEVKPNDTGMERVLPIDIGTVELNCHVKFTQAK